MGNRTAQEWRQALSKRQKTLEKEWFKDAREILKVYDGGKEVPFNILYSNTETLLPTLYNSTPRPEVARRFTQPMQNDRALDSAVSQVAERLLEYLADSNTGDYPNFDDAVKDTVLEALLPGAGQLRVRLVAEEGFQTIRFEHVPYDRFLWGYARKWEQVPWVAFGHDLDKAGVEKQFPKFARTKAFKDIDWKALAENDGDGHDVEEQKRKEPSILVWEVHDGEQISYVSDAVPDEFLLEEPVQLRLSTKWPCMAPLRLVRRPNNLTPRPLYSFYRKQAEELNDLTRRLAAIIKAIKVRGVYNSAIEEFAKVLSEDNDTALVPSQNAAAFSDKGLDGNIWLMPLDMLMGVADKLFQAREQCKATIYEIMGIADILRGASDPSETAKAQEIKNQWGGLKVKRAQKDVQTFCRGAFRIALEIAAQAFTPATYKSITKLPFLFQAEKQQLQMAAARQQPPQPGQPPQPPAQPPLNPMQQYQLGLPTWEEIGQVLQDRFERSFRVDIETNSTVDLEATEDKQAIAEFMNAFGQMMSGLTPLVESGTMPFDVAKLMLSEVVKRYRFGRRMEDALELMQAPQPKDDGKAKDEKHKAELERVRADSSKQVAEATQQMLDLTRRYNELAGKLVEEKIGMRARENELKQDHAQKQAMLRDSATQEKHNMAQERLGLREKSMNDGQAAFSGAAKSLTTVGQQLQKAMAAPMEAVQQLTGQLQQLMQAVAAMQQQVQGLVAKAAEPPPARQPRQVEYDPVTGKASAIRQGENVFPIGRDAQGRMTQF